MKTFKIQTNKRNQVIDVTDEVREIVSESGVKNGLCVVYVPHSTASVIINENWDPNINDDFLELLTSLVPKGKWRHDKVDGNGDSHIKAAICGPSETIIIKDGDLLLGKWQNVMIADFDGPRERKVFVVVFKN